MNQKDFNQLSKKDILTLLVKHPERNDITDIALNILGKDTREWYEARGETELGHIVNPETGKWVTPFMANGKKYHIRSVKEGLGFVRYKQLKQMLSVVGFNATYAEQIQAFNRMIKAANSLVTKEPKLDVLFAEIENMKQAIQRTDKHWDYSLYAATLFITREGEDMNTWSESEANEKIADWQAEGLHEFDFFTLVILYAMQLSQWWEALPAQVRRLYPEARI
jgi:hypothetical protein